MIVEFEIVCMTNHTSYRKFYFTDFVQNSFHCNMDITIFDPRVYERLLEAKNSPQKAKKAQRSGFFEKKFSIKVVQ